MPGKGFRYNPKFFGKKVLGNWFGDGSDGDVTISVDTQLASVQDGDIVVSNFNNLTIDAGFTYTLSNRCRGWIVYCLGDSVINGTLSMTARGCHANPTDSGVTVDTPVAPSDGNAVPANGITIRRLAAGQTDTNTDTDLFYGCGNDAVNSEANQPEVNGNGVVYQIPRVGGLGAAPITGSDGQTGGTASNAPGGGGSGASSAGELGGNGGDATCFSGGTGGGGMDNFGPNAGDGDDYGGQGGFACDSGGVTPTSGGSGNPGGIGAGAGAGCANNPAADGSDGTGGFLLLIVKGTLSGNGVIECDGVQTFDITSGVTGGSSGGGVAIVLYGTASTFTGTVQANGGAQTPSGARNGGAGGPGSVIGPTQIDT